MGNKLNTHHRKKIQLQQSDDAPQQQQQQPAKPIQTAQNIWQTSSKSITDLINFIESIQQQQRALEKAKIFITSLTNRQKLLQYLLNLENYVLEMQNYQCKLNQQNKRILLDFVHPKLSSIWFIWNEISSTSMTPMNLHEEKLPQIYNNLDFAIKLSLLFTEVGAIQTLPLYPSNINHVQYDKFIKQAVRTNYPFLVTKQTISSLFTTIIEHQVFLQNTILFTNFIRNMGELLGTGKGIQLCNSYIQKLYQIMGKSNDKYEEIHKFIQISALNKANQKKYSIHKSIIQCGRLFLSAGYPYAMELLFQTFTQLPQVSLEQNQIRLYTYTKIYSLFLYSFQQLTLHFDDLQKMNITNIIHTTLKSNNLSMLAKLKDVFLSVAQFENKYIGNYQQQVPVFNFSRQLEEYIFSNQCSLNLCLEIIGNRTQYIEVGEGYPERQQRLIAKLNQYKFETIIENQNVIKTVFEISFTNSESMGLLLQKIDEILQIIRLFFMFGVNQKFALLTAFYCPSPQSQSHRDSQMSAIEQQKALYLFKLFTSKFYISTIRNKKIILNPKSPSPLAIDLSKPESIFQITQYLYDKFLKKGLYSINQLHQIIFQHMICFYRYEDAKAVINNDNLIKKYCINNQMLQMIVIQNIVKTIKQSNDINKIINDINYQQKLIKNNQSVQAQSAKAMIKLVKYLNQNGIYLTPSQKDKMNMNTMLSLLDRYSDRIEVLEFGKIYEQIKAINSNEIIDEEEHFIMTNELLIFKSKLAAKAYEVGKKNLGNDTIEEISRFNPPWLTTQLIEIFKKSNGKIDKQNFVIAFNACSKGSELKYLMNLWKEQEKYYVDGTEKKRQEFAVIDNLLIKDEEGYNSYVITCQLKDKILGSKKYELFFILLGSEHEQAFHYALHAQLDPSKLDTFLKESMKANIIDPYYCIPHHHKYLYHILKMERQRLQKSTLPNYRSYIKLQFIPTELEKDYRQLLASQQKSPICKLYLIILAAFISFKQLNEKFINTYFANIKLKGKINVEYELLFNAKIRQDLLIDLREEPMTKQNIIILNHICTLITDINLIYQCILRLADIINTSYKLDDKCENLLNKIVILSLNKPNECQQIMSTLIQKIFSIDKLVQISAFLTAQSNPLFRQIITERRLRILISLSNVEIDNQSQFYGIIPPNFFLTQIKHHPKWPLTEAHEKLLKKACTRTNILVLSKVMYFIYGMNADVQKKIIRDYLDTSPDPELEMIVGQLE